MMQPGRRSKLLLTISVIWASDLPERVTPVPYVSTKTDHGLDKPIAYDNWTRTRWHKPALTSDLATQRAA